MPTLTSHSIGPGVTVQDLGRPGWTVQGLSTGGAADRLAILEAAALLGTPPQAGLEMMGFGGVFSTDANSRIVLTGAHMQATIDDSPAPHNTTILLQAGQRLNIGGAKHGTFGYLSFAGGIQTDLVLESRSTHLTAGIGAVLQASTTLQIGADSDTTSAPMRLTTDDRTTGGLIRVMPGPQTAFFSDDTKATFAQTTFVRSPRGNRQGVRLDHDGAGFSLDGALNITSDLIVPGDIQMTGEGVPYVLLSECQTIGGYPRIGTVLPADLPKLVQAAPGTKLRFAFISLADADATAVSDTTLLANLCKDCQPMIRDPHDIVDLLSYQLISGVTAGNDP